MFFRLPAGFRNKKNDAEDRFASFLCILLTGLFLVAAEQQITGAGPCVQP